jgi:hypothetical protein
MFLLPLPLFEQLFHVARLGNLGEINLRLDLRRRSSLPGGRARLGGKVLSDFFRFIRLNGA